MTASLALMLKLTNTQLINRLKKTEECTFISLRAVVEPEMRKTCNPFHGRVLKVVTAAGSINFRYSRVVNSQRIREGKPADFKAKMRQWGEKLDDCPLIKHVNAWGRVSYYLDIKIQSRVDQYRDIETGRLITKDQLLQWLPPHQKTRQGLNRVVSLRDFRIDRIAEIKINGEVWQVRSGFAKLERLLKGTA
ncbi:MAG: hypothetical protein IPL86_19180 [Flavobacteriales bacterium]|nr:hypothetical protein [Flavobacteriales bacterium]